MKISKLALIALLGGALMAFGCGSDSGTGGAGAGGDGGAGGAGGEGGSGGAPGVDDPCEGSPSCVFCPADSLDPVLATFLPDGLTAPIIFTAAPTAAPVAGEDVTIDIDAETFIAGLAVAVSLSVTEGGTTTYVATGSADTAEIDIPLQTVMGAANEDLVIELGAGSGDFLVDKAAPLSSLSTRVAAGAGKPHRQGPGLEGLARLPLAPPGNPRHDSQRRPHGHGLAGSHGPSATGMRPPQEDASHPDAGAYAVEAAATSEPASRATSNGPSEAPGIRRSVTCTIG